MMIKSPSCIRCGVGQKCTHCHSTHVIRSGKTTNGKQRLLCKCCNERFLDAYSYNAYQPETNQQIILFTKEGFVPAESPEGDSANVVGKALDLCNVNQNKYRGNRREVYITFTCYRWLPLFEVVNGYDIIYKQFDILKSEGHSIIGYVIMPNHVHFVIDFSNTVRHINKRIGTMKRFIA